MDSNLLNRRVPLKFEGGDLTYEERRSLQVSIDQNRLDADFLMRAVRVIVRIRGKEYNYQDHFGPACVNFALRGADLQPVPACIIGSVFYLFGITERECTAGGGIVNSVDSVKRHLPEVQITKGFRDFGHVIQNMQDKGAKYGAVLDALNSMRMVFTNSVTTGYYEHHEIPTQQFRN